MKQYRPILFSFLLLALCLTAACAWDNPSPAPGDASSSSAGEPGESSAVAVSDVIPFSQAVTQYAGNAGLSYQAARTAFPAGTDAEPAEEAHYRILSLPLSVTASYTPRLILYCAVSEADASLPPWTPSSSSSRRGTPPSRTGPFTGISRFGSGEHPAGVCHQRRLLQRGNHHSPGVRSPHRPWPDGTGHPLPPRLRVPLISSISMTIRRSPFPLPWHNGVSFCPRPCCRFPL